MKPVILLAALALGLSPQIASATGISTHILDLSKGVGGRDVPVVLLRKDGDRWIAVAQARTDTDGRVRSFAGASTFPAGTYKLSFDMARYASGQPAPFFPEIDVVFSVADGTAHYHVPVVVSPFGYSTYRGN